ncbi:glycosyltransferase [Ruminococcus sp. OM05-10BH]|nr:glycosyltransferase [Ruminococcus sp. OM05-10BH]
MKILAIAYACEPNRGSEPGVGWNWVRNMSRCDDIELSVITRKNNKDVIDFFVKNNSEPDNIEFLYYDLPTSVLKHKHGDKNIKLFFTLWQLGVVRYIKSGVKLEDYDYVWDFNFGSLALPSFVYKLKKKYVVGPVSTKESIPEPYLKKLSGKARMRYSVQQFMRVHLWTNPFTWKTLKKSSLILTCNEMSRKYLPKGKKSIAVFHNGLDVEDSAHINISTSGSVRFVYAGRFIESKNLELALRAFARVAQHTRDFCFEIYGSGPLKNKLIGLVASLKLEDVVLFKDKVSQKELFEIYQNRDCFVFPSLLEISSTAVMEAMYFGMIPVCLDINCMEYILDNDCVMKVPNVSPEVDEVKFADALMKVIQTKSDLLNKKQQCHKYAAKHFLWSEKKEEIEKVAHYMENM